MRQAFSTTFGLTGVVLGVAAGGLLIALQWSDVMGDLQSAKALRHIAGMFTSAILLAGLVGWPFWWLADKLSPEDSDEGADAATPQTSHLK